MLATIYASCLQELHLIPFTLPISLNSLDREGVRLLSPRDSQMLPKPACRCHWMVQVMQPSSRRSSMKILSFVLFRFSWLVVEPSWGWSRTLSHGVLLLFWFRSRTLIVFGWCNALFMYCVKWRSQLCIFFPYVLHGLCEDYPTCDIAYNAVMPLSHASTRGRYSRIEGITSW